MHFTVASLSFFTVFCCGFPKNLFLLVLYSNCMIDDLITLYFCEVYKPFFTVCHTAVKSVSLALRLHGQRACTNIFLQYMQTH